MLIAPLTYDCRVCGTSKEIYVSPTEVDGELVIDADGRHRVATADCQQCECERTHVAAPPVADSAPSRTDSGEKDD